MKTLGEQIRMIRKQKKRTLKYVAEKAGVSISFLSQLELNKTNATLETLKKISLVLDVHPSIFFNDVEEDQNYPFHYKDLSNGLAQTSFKPMHVTMHPGENHGKDFSHIGHEFIYIIAGEMIVTYDGKRYPLYAGESLMIDSSLNHYWLNESSENVEFIVVTSV